MSDYRIYFSFNNRENVFELPVNPESIEISNGQNSKQYDIAALGEINVIKSPQLTEYTMSSFFPAIDVRRAYEDGNQNPVDPFITSQYYLPPMKYVEYIQSWMASKKPMRMNISSPTININTAASIEKFQWKEVAGSGGDIEYTITLKEFIFYAAKSIIVDAVPESNKTLIIKKTTRPNERQTPRTYKLIAGDNLSKIAKKILGDDSRWREIQKLNGIQNHQLKNLPIGMVIRLPKG